LPSGSPIELWTTEGEWQQAGRALADRPGTFNTEFVDF
jgi:hypothetical protein